MKKKERVLLELLKYSSKPNQTLDWMLNNLNEEWNFIQSNEVIGASRCICGNNQIKTEFVFKNEITKKEVILGSTCILDINFVNAKELKTISDLLTKIKQKQGKYIENWKDFFNSKLLMFFYVNGFFDNNSNSKYTEKTPKEKYDILNKFFLKKNQLSSQQEKMKNGIIFFELIPKLKEKNYLFNNNDYQKYLKYAKNKKDATKEKDKVEIKKRMTDRN